VVLPQSKNRARTRAKVTKGMMTKADAEGATWFDAGILKASVWAEMT
jgi:hypothetical protein